MNKIYHSCLYKNEGGSNKLYRKGKIRCSGTNCPFWQHPKEIKKKGIITRSQEKKQQLVNLKEYNRYFRDLLKREKDMNLQREIPNWDNHDKNICSIKNYYIDRERAEEVLLRQEIQIENTCEYCLVCEKCKRYLTYSKEYKKTGFWTFNKNVRIWEVFNPDWSYKNTVFEIKPCKL